MLGTLTLSPAYAQGYRVKGSGEDAAPSSKTSTPTTQGLQVIPELGLTQIAPGVPNPIIPVERPTLTPEEVNAILNKQEEKPEVNHEVFAKILQKFITKSGWVDYRSLKRDKDAMADLHSYVKDLSAMNPSTFEDPKDKLASWLNLYNATILEFILKNYPVDSLNRIKGFYEEKMFKIGDKQYSILDVDEEVFRNELKDARTVFGRVQGYTSGPQLTKEAFTASKVDQQLDERTFKFLADPANVRFDTRRNLLTLNGLLSAYERDFPDMQGFLMTYLNRLPPRFQWMYVGNDFKLNDEKLH